MMPERLIHANIVQLLAWCRRFRLRGQCRIRDREGFLTLSTGDPIFPAREQKQYDSQLEKRFAKDFRKCARDFDLICEPEPVVAGGTLIFPDFAIQSRRYPKVRWLLEILGFWTPDYLERKLSLLRSARIPNLILCLDDERNCGEGELPEGAPVIRFRRRIDPAAILRVIGVDRVPG